MARNIRYTALFYFISILNLSAQKNTNEIVLRQLIFKNAATLGFTLSDVNNSRILSSYYDDHAEATMVYLQQTYEGVDVYNAITTIAFKDNKVASVASSRINDIAKRVKNNSTKAIVMPLMALRNAAAEISLPIKQAIAIPLRQSPDGHEFEYDKMGIGFNNLRVQLIWTPAVEDEEHFYLSWQVTIYTLHSNDYWLIKVDALTGKILLKQNLTKKCRWQPLHAHEMECYEDRLTDDGTKGEEGIQMINSAKFNVIPFPFRDLDHSNPTLVTNPWSIFPNTKATSLKWNNDGIRDYDSTKGNNVYAQPDLDANNNTLKNAPRSQTTLPDLTFNFAPNFNADPVNDIATRSFSVVNLFYWNNIMHDISYQYGFDEVAGNFQVNNLGRGGKGNDLVIADALDASGANNANFATPVDGNSPRMQMYVWNPSHYKILEVTAPSAYVGYKAAAESNFSTQNKLVSVGSKSAQVVFYKDIADPAKHNACGDAANAAELKGKIAYINRQGCVSQSLNAFTNKVKNAQNAGAIGVIIGDTVRGSTALITMGGNDNTITIPAVFISTEEANKLKTYLNLGTVVNATLHAAPRIDGDLDNSVVAHEYTHGISYRLTGGPNTVSCLSNKEQMGEGWSDYVALMITTDWAAATVIDDVLPRPIGNYASGLPKNFGGIRTYPYSTDFNINPWTYDSLRTNPRVNSDDHVLGEVWCNMLWEMTWELIKSDGINTAFWNASGPGGNSIAMRLVIEGMKLQKCNPGFVDGRDGILKADSLLYGGKYSPSIWRAFARRGLGYSANQRNSNNIPDGTAAYDVPSTLPSLWGSFTAEKINNTALLKWTTLTEQNVEKFIIERSVDGRNFGEVAFIKATGNSIAERSYTYTDLKPAMGVNIYRVRSVDRDGKYSYSDVRALTFGNIKNLISLTPNPARFIATLTVKENRETLQIKLYNSVGQQLASYTLNGESMPINISRFSSGLYYLSITSETINQKIKFIIQAR